MFGFIQTLMAKLLGQLGQQEQAVRLLREGRAQLQRVREPYSTTWLSTSLTWFLTATPASRKEGAALAAQIIKEGVAPPCPLWAWSAHARALLLDGSLAEAEKESRGTLEAGSFFPTIALEAHSLLVESLLQQNRPQEALAEAERALSHAAPCSSVASVRTSIGLGLAQAYAATGNPDAAQRTLRGLLAQIEQQASAIPDADLRASYLNQLPENLRARELAGTWLGHDPFA
jgi:hypothetical protein